MGHWDLSRAREAADVGWSMEAGNNRDYQYALAILALVEVCERQGREIDQLQRQSTPASL